MTERDDELQPGGPDAEPAAADPGADPGTVERAEEAGEVGQAETGRPDLQLRREIEALVFISPEGVALKRLADVLDAPAQRVRELADELAAEYRERGSGLRIIPVAGGYQLVTADDLAGMVERHLTVVRRKHLSQPAMETLAIIAYRQPITKPELEAIRGVDSSGVLTGLLDKKLIRLAGRKKAPGKPLMYATTRDFLLRFGLRDLRELPALAELGRSPDEVVEMEEGAPDDAAESSEAPSQIRRRRTSGGEAADNESVGDTSGGDEAFVDGDAPGDPGPLDDESPGRV